MPDTLRADPSFEVSAVSQTIPRATAALRLSSRRALGAIVLIGAAVQTVLAQGIPSPTVFPDEYVYSQLGRSLATTGHLQVRGVSAHFLPVLEPILTAPAWLLGDVGVGFHTIQVENALVYSLAAVPAYLIARRLGATAGLSLAVAALAIATPSTVYTARILSEPFAYPLALAVVAAALGAVEQPTRRNQAWLLTFAGLAAFARLQLGALAIAAAAAFVVAGLREHRVRAAAREQRLVLGVVGGVLVLGVTVALVHGLGYYHLAPHPDGATATLRMLGLNLYVLVIAAGGVIVPSAVVGLVLAVAKPRSRAELTFGLITTFFAVGLLVQCLLWGDVSLVQERYLFYLVPLLAVAFALRMTRAARRALAETAVAAAVACFAAAVPLSGPAVEGTHAFTPTLRAFMRVQSIVHTPAAAATVFALGTTALVAIGAALAGRRRGAVAAACLSVAAAAAAFLGASSRSAMMAHAARAYYLPADAHWIDHLGLGDTTMLVVGRAPNSPALATLFWNPSIARVVRAPGATKVDWLDDPVAAIGADGTVRVRGAALTAPVVVAADPIAAVELTGARVLGRYNGTAVWQPHERVRLKVQMTGRLPDGGVLGTGGVRLWSPTGRFAGWVEVRVTAPADVAHAVVSLHGRREHARVALAAGETQLLRVRACGAGGWRGGFAASPAHRGVGTWASPRLSVARYVPDPTACS